MIPVRNTLIGERASHEGLESILNSHARLGWMVKSITATSVTGRVGPHGVDGLLVVFERPVLA